MIANFKPAAQCICTQTLLRQRFQVLASQLKQSHSVAANGLPHRTEQAIKTIATGKASRKVNRELKQPRKGDFIIQFGSAKDSK